MMRLPPGYQDRLRRFDAELRMRWSERRHVWLLERRARYQRITIDPAAYGYGEHDTVQQMRDGYFALGTYGAQELPSVDHLIAYLRTQDTRRLGDQDFDRLANGLADELDQQHVLREEQLREAARADVGDRAADLWESDRWKSGVRVTVPRSLPA